MYIVLTVDTLTHVSREYSRLRDRPHAVDPNHFGLHNPTFVRTMHPVVRFGMFDREGHWYDRRSAPIPVGSHSRMFQRRLRRVGQTMFVSQLVLKSFALLVVFVLPSASVVVAQQQEEDEDNSSLTNYNALREEGQGFYLLKETSSLYEKPGSVVTPFVALNWWCNLEFSSNDADIYGYVGQGAQYALGSAQEDIVAQGSQSFPSKKRALSVSAVW